MIVCASSSAVDGGEMGLAAGSSSADDGGADAGVGGCDCPPGPVADVRCSMTSRTPGVGVGSCRDPGVYSHFCKNVLSYGIR